MDAMREKDNLMAVVEVTEQDADDREQNGDWKCAVTTPHGSSQEEKNHKPEVSVDGIKLNMHLEVSLVFCLWAPVVGN